MDEYIEKEDIEQKIQLGLNNLVLGHDAIEILGMIYEMPAADVAPVVHGRWDDSGRYTFPGGSTAVRCTNCGCALTVSEYHLNNWNYCPVCGAKMDGVDDG